jgi:hypothetical protein
MTTAIEAQVKAWLVDGIRRDDILTVYGYSIHYRIDQTPVRDCYWGYRVPPVDERITIPRGTGYLTRQWLNPGRQCADVVGPGLRELTGDGSHAEKLRLRL